MQDKIKLTNIDTDRGNAIMQALVSDGWKITRQYSPLAFDKGIDFDFYTLVKDGSTVRLEWDNWFEWSFTGDKSVMAAIAARFDLQMPEPGSDGI